MPPLCYVRVKQCYATIFPRGARAGCRARESASRVRRTASLHILLRQFARPQQLRPRQTLLRGHLKPTLVNTVYFGRLQDLS